MSVRSTVQSLQLPVTAVGAVLLAWSVASLDSVLAQPSRAAHYMNGLAVVFLYLLACAGLTVLSLGLSIPTDEGRGVSFSPHQRQLFLTAAGGGFLSAVAPMLLIGLMLANPGLFALLPFVLFGFSAILVIVGVGWRASQAFRA